MGGSRLLGKWVGIGVLCLGGPRECPDGYLGCIYRVGGIRDNFLSIPSKTQTFKQWQKTLASVPH